MKPSRKRGEVQRGGGSGGCQAEARLERVATLGDTASGCLALIVCRLLNGGRGGGFQ